MIRLLHAVRSSCFAALVVLVGFNGVSAKTCVQTDLGQFYICVPADWRLTQGRVDSLAGKFEGDGLKVIYDFGLYSDPLRIPEGATEPQEAQVQVDGHAARQVTYTVHSKHFAGVNVPSIRVVSMGVLKLTVLAESADKAKLDAAKSAFATIQFKPPAN